MNGFYLKRTYIGQLPYGASLYESLTEIVLREDIRIGRFTGIGATKHARIGYYNQNSKQYQEIEFHEGMEILSLQGNISIRDGKPFVHAHITLSDSTGATFGGHLLPGTIVFACELTIDIFEGEELVREYDERTGSYLWKNNTLTS